MARGREEERITRPPPIKRKPLRGPTHPQPPAGTPPRFLVGPRSLHSADHGPVGAEDFAAVPLSESMN